VLWILAAVGFRIYLALGSGAPTGVVVNNAQVVLIGRAVGAVVATVLWTYFSSIAILVGNELNAELARRRGVAGEVGTAMHQGGQPGSSTPTGTR
jgi:uncharacterized BrkB/YihY/UPF0761 family membrane protein